MQPDKTKRLHLCTSTDQLKPALTGVYYKDNKLIATDGHKMVVVDTLEKEKHEPAIIPAAIFREYCKKTPKSMRESEITISERQVTLERFAPVHYTMTMDLITENYPDYERVFIPEIEDIPNCDIKISFDAGNLKDLVDSMGIYYEGVTLHINSKKLIKLKNGKKTTNQPIPVTINNTPEVSAILLPVRINP